MAVSCLVISCVQASSHAAGLRRLALLLILWTPYLPHCAMLAPDPCKVPRMEHTVAGVCARPLLLGGLGRVSAQLGSDHRLQRHAPLRVVRPCGHGYAIRHACTTT